MARKMSTRGKNVFGRLVNTLPKMEGAFTSADLQDSIVAVRRVEVNNMLNKLEREGMVRRAGEKKTYDGVGRKSIVWEVTPQYRKVLRQKNTAQ